MIIGIFALFLALDKKRVGVVRTIDLVEKYRGMEDARAAFEEQRIQWQAELDTRQQAYGAAVSALNAEWRGLSKGDREKRRELIARQEKDIAQFTQGVQGRIRAEEKRLEGEILEKVNDVIKAYALEHGYDVIFGATGDGSILHSVDELDITDELIEVLNRNYKPPVSDDTGSL